MMKFSIEEKAKAYDELFAKAKTMMVENTNEVDGAKILTNLFPQLAESEDERIRKAMIKYFINGKEYLSLTPYSREDYIAWLEKQGTDISSFPEEQQVFMQKYVSLDKVTLIKLLAERDANNAEIIESFEKQGEPKEINPSEFDSQLNRLLGQFKSLPKEELASSLCFYLNVVQNNGTYKEEKQGEQETLCDKCRKAQPSHSCQDIAALGRCALEKRGEQKPAEWTKEDKERYISCLQKLSTGNPEQPETINSKWFKEHVYPKPQWKPSDKQIYSLDRVLSFYGKGTVTYDFVKELLEQLKKL